MPTIQEGNLTNPIRTPGYWGFFSGGNYRRSGAGMPDMSRKTLPAARSVNPARNNQTTMYSSLGSSSPHTTRSGAVRVCRQGSFDRHAGVPNYSTFNTVDRDEAGAITQGDELDKLSLLHKKDPMHLREPIRGPSYFPEPVSSNNMYIRANWEPWRSKVLPLPSQNDEISKHLYKVYDDMKPKFSRSRGMIYHNNWGVQDGIGLLAYRRAQEDQKNLYMDQEEYRRLVEDRRKTGGRVMSVMGVNYDNPRTEFYRPLYTRCDVNPVQKQLAHLYQLRQYDVGPTISY